MGKEGLLHVVRGSHPELEDRSAREAGPENGPPAARVQSARGLVSSAWSHQPSFPSGIGPELLAAWRALLGESSDTLSLLISAAAWPFTMGLDPTEHLCQPMPAQARALQPGVPTPDSSHPQGPCSHFRDEKIEAETDQSSDKSHSHQQVAGLELEVGLPFPVLP